MRYIHGIYCIHNLYTCSYTYTVYTCVNNTALRKHKLKAFNNYNVYIPGMSVPNQAIILVVLTAVRCRLFGTT